MQLDELHQKFFVLLIGEQLVKFDWRFPLHLFDFFIWFKGALGQGLVGNLGCPIVNLFGSPVLKHVVLLAKMHTELHLVASFFTNFSHCRLGQRFAGIHFAFGP